MQCQGHSHTDFDGKFKGALGVHQIPLDNIIGRLELLEFGVLWLTNQVLSDRQQCL